MIRGTGDFLASAALAILGMLYFIVRGAGIVLLMIVATPFILLACLVTGRPFPKSGP
jgi:uncharacterized membrane protein YbaN (DUF454 family)